MIKTQLVIFHRPNNGNISTGSVDYTSSYSLRTLGNYNSPVSQTSQKYTIPAGPQSGQGLSIDLYDDVPIPITFSILDIREPDKRKTSWSKTITIPGTKNNNRIFSHIYEIGQDGWITIGGQSLYEGFNPNLAKEIILLNDGIQVLKGNLQMKKIKRDKNGNIEYEVALNGDLTSLFYDVGTTKLSDLDFSEWDHDWSKETIENSWKGLLQKANNGSTYSITNGSSKSIKSLYRDPKTGRLGIETYTAHGLLEDDWVFLDLKTDVSGSEALNAAKGEFIITERTSLYKFVVNYFYPVILMSSGSTVNLPAGSVCYKRTANGVGYIYPMISWGEEYDYNSFAVSSFVPGFYVKEIFDKIMKETKSTYESTFLNSQFFKRLFVIQKKTSYDLNPSDIQNRRFLVGTTQSYLTGASYRAVQNWYNPNFANPDTTATASLFPSTLSLNMPFKSEKGVGLTVSYYDYGLTSSNIYGNWDQSVYSWKVQDTGEYRLTANIRLSAWIDMNGYDGSPADGTASFTLNDPKYVYYTGPSYWAPSGPVGSNATGMAIKAKIMRRRNGFVSEIGTNTTSLVMNSNSSWPNSNWKYFGRYQPTTWENLSLNITSTSTYFAENDEVWIELLHFVQARPGSWYSNQGRTTGIAFYEWYNPPGSDDPPETYDINGEFYYKVEAGSFVVNDPSPKSTEGSVMRSSNALPKDMACKDFLLAIIKSFNLHIEGDKQIERKYYIEPRDEYYKTGSGGLTDYVDWSNKIDETSIDIIPMGELIAKYYTFQNKPENDYWNKKFKEDRGRDYMSYTKEIENDFLKNESKIEIPFGSTVMINNPSDTDIVMPAILQKESNANKPVSNSLPRMLIYGGLRPYTAQRGGVLGKVSSANGSAIGWELLSSSQSTTISASSSAYPQYPYAGTVDNPIDPIYDINWYNMEVGDFVYWDMARWTNENLYNKYWSNFIKEVSDPASKVISADMRLTAKDIYELDFRKIYVIDNNYLRLQKIIDYDPVNDGLTRCEFLKLKSPSKFRRKSQIVDYSGMSDIVFETYTTTTAAAIKGTILEVAPAKRRPDLGYTNTNSNSNLSNSASVMTNGLSNYVSSGVKNAKINGNENAIGADVINVNITSGDGNYIAGGVKNVNIIGTDKKYISESDITYINGIRYKNGIAISKSNVINGGFNMAIVRSSDSTNVNVINASEDVVITSGTSNFENIINAGIDAILPDVKELGIASTLNPTPRTSLAGSYNLAIGTQSYVEVVRQAQANVSLS